MKKIIQNGSIVLICSLLMFSLSCKKEKQADTSVQNQVSAETKAETVSEEDMIPGLVIVNTYILEKNDANSNKLILIDKGSGVKILPLPDVPYSYLSNGFYNIDFNGTRGWIREDMLVQNFRVSKDGEKVAWLSQPITFILYDVKSKKQSTYEIEADLAEFELSDSCKYFAFNEGTDVVGNILIFKTETGEQVYSAPFPRHEMVWEGEKISIQKIVTECKDHKVRWEEEIFNDGVVSAGTKKGEADCNE